MKKKGIFLVKLLALWLFFFLFAGHVLAIDTGLQATAGVNGAGYNTDINLQTYIGLGIKAILGVAGAVFFAVLVYGGILWMISNGEEGKIKSARTMIVYSVMGLIIILGGFAIVNFVTTNIAEETLK